jgi:gluconate 2-dehydrogenase gamma chain
MTRREIIRNAALAAAAGASTAASGQHVHEAVQDKKASGGPYRSKAFTATEYTTLRRLCDLIIPADAQSKGALDGNAPEYIDLLAANNPELASLYTGGLAWLEAESKRRYNSGFAAAKPEQQTALLDLIAFKKNDGPEVGPGIRFFDLARQMTVDAFYTSPAGIRALGYMGNKGMTTFQVPAEAITYAMKRSGLG